VAKAASTNSAAKASSMPIRDCTCDSPSQISSTPATPPSSVEPVSRRTSRIITSTISVPTTALAIRQP